MGGGPEHSDVIRASCLLTFPEKAEIDPVPIDAWYLHAVGRCFLRRLVRDRIGNDIKCTLLMQIRKDQNGYIKRYICVKDDTQLQLALEDTFKHPEYVLVLHVVYIDEHTNSVMYVKPETNPNISPEPVLPLAMVFPTLSIDGMSSEMQVYHGAPVSLSKMSTNFSPTHKKIPKYQDTFDDKHENNMTDSIHMPPLASCYNDRMNWRKSDEIGKSGNDKMEHESDVDKIPLARIVSGQDARENGDGEDFVMLELQHGAGFSSDMNQSGDSSSNGEGSNLNQSRYFISSRWYLQANGELDNEVNTHRDQVNNPPSQNQETTSSTGLEESFVMLRSNNDKL